MRGDTEGTTAALAIVDDATRQAEKLAEAA